MMKNMEHLSNYCTTHPDAKIRYHTSDIQLCFHLDGSYLGETEAKSRWGGHHFLGIRVETTEINGPILALAKVFKNILSSATEPELGGMFNTTKEVTVETVTLEELDHLQKRTQVVCDKTMAVGITNKSINNKRSKVMDMRLFW